MAREEAGPSLDGDVGLRVGRAEGRGSTSTDEAPAANEVARTRTR